MFEEDENLGVSDALSTNGMATPDTDFVQRAVDVDRPHNEETFDLDEESVDPKVQGTQHTVQPTQEPLDGRDIEAANSERLSNADDIVNANQTGRENRVNDAEPISDVELERELNKLYLGVSHIQNEHQQSPANGKPKIGAAKAKRLKRAENRAALEAGDRTPQKPMKNRKPFDPSEAVQKARGETVTTGRRTKKK